MDTVSPLPHTPDRTEQRAAVTPSPKKPKQNNKSCRFSNTQKGQGIDPNKNEKITTDNTAVGGQIVEEGSLVGARGTIIDKLR